MKKLYCAVIAMLLAGTVLILFPCTGNYLNEKNQSKIVSEYTRMAEKTDPEMIRSLFEEAEEYNRQLFQRQNPLVAYKAIKGYYDLLNVNQDGVMGYLTIDSIGVRLAIYHGTSEEVLSVGCGHVMGSSLPVGGNSTHSVLSAHSGLPTARLFTDLCKMKIGDRFCVTVLNRKLIYEVDLIQTVSPDNVKSILIMEDCDLCTLITCTPYGINTHRYLVRGKRIQPGEFSPG